MNSKKICIVGAYGKLGRYMVQHAVDRGYEVVGVCRERSVSKLEGFKWRITVLPGATNDRKVSQQAVAGCDGVLTVLVPWGADQYSTGTAEAVLDYARPEARLIFSCGWHITRDGQDVYPQSLKREEKLARWLGRFTHIMDIDDQVEACRRVFASDTRWTVVRGSDLEAGESQGLPVWSRHVGDPILERESLLRRLHFEAIVRLRNFVARAAKFWSADAEAAAGQAGRGRRLGWLRVEGFKTNSFPATGKGATALRPARAERRSPEAASLWRGPGARSSRTNWSRG